MASAQPQLPPELWAIISENLSNKDCKNLRLANVWLGKVVRFRLNRVFLSPNPLNLHVFHAIADHDKYRLGIEEIVYDDARFSRTPGHPGQQAPYPLGWKGNSESEDEQRCKRRWFAWQRRMNLEDITRRRKVESDDEFLDAAKLEGHLQAHLSIEKSLELYRTLLEQQEAVMATDQEAEALRYGLVRFPALKRVIVTSLTHGDVFSPLYETPMIRKFPRGFNYPIPRGWQCEAHAKDHHDRSMFLEQVPGHVPPAPLNPSEASDQTRTRSRGYGLALRVLAENLDSHRVVELILNGHSWGTGLDYTIFKERNQDLDNLVSVISQPGFHTLNLTVLADRRKGLDAWPVFQSPLFKEALRKASSLRSLSLSLSGEQLPALEGENLAFSLAPDLPVDAWQNLSHFALANVTIKKDDLINLLASLPATLQTVTLSFPSLSPRKHYHIITDIRDRSGWPDREVRPRLTILMKMHSAPFSRPTALWLDDCINDYLYEGGDCPFEDSMYGLRERSRGWIRDLYLPEYDRRHWHTSRRRFLGKDTTIPNRTFSLKTRINALMDLEDEELKFKCLKG